MGTVLVVDGSGVCRAAIVAFVLGRALGPASAFGDVEVASRGLEARPGTTMCESASARLGRTGPAIAFFGAHRAAALTLDDVRDADVVLTAERAQRSAVVRMLPGIRAAVFTWKEALVLSTVLADRVRTGAAVPPEDLPTLARALHGARGTVPMIEPPVRTGVLHRRRPAEADPLTVEDGHDGIAQHRRVTQESYDIASRLALQLAGLRSGETLGVGVAEARPSLRRRLQRA